jgi:hypothetical protein
MKRSRLIAGLFAGSLLLASVAAATPALAADLGVEWSSATVPVGATSVDSVAFGDGVFISVNDDGVILRSTDGKTWTEVDTQNDYWAGVTYGDGTFVVVGGENYASSTDGGLTWSAPGTFSNYWYYTVAYGNGVFVTAEGDDCTTMSQTSPDGITWTPHAGALNANPCWQDIAFSGTNFVAIGDEDVEYSADGIIWTDSTLPSSFTAGDSSLNSVATDGAGNLIAVATEWTGSQYNSLVIKSTDNGVTWTQVDFDELDANYFESVAYGNGTWLLGEGWSASTNEYGMLRSVDAGTTWTDASAPGYWWNDIAYGADTFVAVGYADTRILSLDDTSPIAWSVGNPTLPDTGASDYTLSITLAASALLVGACVTVLSMVRRRRDA